MIAGALIVVAGVAVAGFFVLRGSETKGSDKSSRANEEDDEKRAPRRSASAPTSVASAPTTQAPQPSAQPTTTCVGLDCEPFPMADPAALDPVALLAPATKLALRIDPTAKLAGLFAHDCAIGGVCDTRRNLRVQVGFSVDGGGGIYVSVQGAQLVADKASSMFPNGGGIVPPKCSFKAVYDEAVANGLPSAGKTSGQYRFDASLKKPMWYFFEKGASIIIDDATCKLMKF
ncbi:MAG: hypothetical protein U0271_42130 [Polyangiaceae bacterium]